MKIISYILVIIGTLIGGVQLLDTMTYAESAPQQGAGAAMALAWAVLPYCFARAVEKLGERSLDEVLGKYFQRKNIDSGPPLLKDHVPFDLPPGDSRPPSGAPRTPQRPVNPPTQLRPNTRSNIFNR